MNKIPFAAFAFALLPVAAHSVARWNGDALTGNNPPAQNVNIPAAVQNNVVRILLGYQIRGSGIETQVFGSGTVLDFTRTENTGRLCILTGNHNTAIPANAVAGLALVFAGFGNGTEFNPPRLSTRVRNVMRPPANGQGRAPDIAIFSVDVTDWNAQVGRELSRLQVADVVADRDLVIAGYGRTGRVDVANRRYEITNDAFGTLRSGTNRSDGIVAHTTEVSPRVNLQYEYQSIESSMQFRPAAPADPTSADAHFLNMDSGGPTLQQQGENWRVVGVHSESEARAGGFVPEGAREWDVQLNAYAGWINDTCRTVLVPEPSTFFVLITGVAGMSFGRLRRCRAQSTQAAR